MGFGPALLLVAIGVFLGYLLFKEEPKLEAEVHALRVKIIDEVTAYLKNKPNLTTIESAILAKIKSLQDYD